MKLTNGFINRASSTGKF